MASKLAPTLTRLLSSSRTPSSKLISQQQSRLSTRSIQTQPVDSALINSSEFYTDTSSTTIPPLAMNNQYTKELAQKYHYLRNIAPRAEQQKHLETLKYPNINPCFRPDLLDIPIQPFNPASGSAMSRQTHQKPADKLSFRRKFASSAFKRTSTTFGSSQQQRSVQHQAQNNQYLDAAALEEYNESYIIANTKPQNPMAFYDEELVLRFGL